MQTKLRKKEIIIIAVLIVAALAAWAVMNRQRDTTDYGSIRISVAGEDFGTYSLGKDQVVKIGSTNTCRIQNGTARMIEASCPDHLCIHQAPIDEKGGFIICLPNQVIIEGIPAETDPGDADEALDGMAG